MAQRRTPGGQDWAGRSDKAAAGIAEENGCPGQATKVTVVLILSRKSGESIVIPGEIVVTVVEQLAGPSACIHRSPDPHPGVPQRNFERITAAVDPDAAGIDEEVATAHG